MKSVEQSWNITTAELCRVLGVSQPTIGAYVRKGLPKVGRGNFDLCVAVQWCLDQVKGDAPDTEEARRRLYVAQEKHKSLETEILRADVVPSEEVRHFCHGLSGEYVAALDALAPRLGGELAAMDQPELIEEVIERETRIIRELLGRKLESLNKRLEQLHPDNKPAPKAARGRMGGRKKNSH